MSTTLLIAGQETKPDKARISLPLSPAQVWPRCRRLPVGFLASLADVINVVTRSRPFSLACSFSLAQNNEEGKHFLRLPSFLPRLPLSACHVAWASLSSANYVAAAVTDRSKRGCQPQQQQFSCQPRQIDASVNHAFDSRRVHSSSILPSSSSSGLLLSRRSSYLAAASAPSLPYPPLSHSPRHDVWFEAFVAVHVRSEEE